MSEFIKTDKQKEAIAVLSSESKYVALFGGSRSGKSFIIIYSLIIRACKEKSRHAIIRYRFNSVKRSIFQDTWPKVMNLCFPNLKVRYNKTDYIAYFPNGSEVHFVGMDEGPRTEKLLGLEFSTLYFNEASELDYSPVQMVLSRLAEKNNLKKRVWLDFNPATKASWSYYLFIKKLDPIDEVPLKDPEMYSYLKMNPSDNLTNIDSEYLSLLERMPEKDRTRFLLGEFSDESQGQVYYSFRRDDHVKEFDRFPGTIWAGQDFNIDPGAAVFASYVDNKFWIFDEVLLHNSDTYKMADEFKKRGYGGARICPDSTGVSRKTSGQSDFEILKKSGFIIESTRNPFVGDRINNTNRLFQENRIIIHPRCRKLINDFEKVVWKDNKLDQGGTNKHLTHISDAASYLFWKIEPFNPSVAKVEFQGRK